MRWRPFGVAVGVLCAAALSFALPLAVHAASSAAHGAYEAQLRTTEVLAYVAAGPQGVSLHGYLDRLSAAAGVSTAVLDSGGAVLDSSGDPDLTGLDPRTAVAAALAGRTSPAPPTIWPGAPATLAVAVPVLRDGVVAGAAVTVADTAGLRAGVARQLWVIGLAELAVLGTLILLAHLLVRWLVAPVYELEEAANMLGAGDLRARVPVDRGPAEVRRLAAAFNRMAVAVRTALDRQAAFVVDASHQLRNPLTVLNLRLETLAATLRGEGSAEMELIRDELGHLDDVLGQLLDLAAAQHAPAVPPADVDAGDLVAGRVDAWASSARARDITIELNLNTATVVRVDPALVGSILDTVLDNAIKFSPDGGRVTVRVTDAAPHTLVEVTDSGPGLDPADLERMGDRFWRGAAAAGVPGSGLGLAIARELAAVVGATLEFVSAGPRGLRVTVALPQPPGRHI